jgi:hypothetical protein
MRKTAIDIISKDYDINYDNEPQFTITDVLYLMREYAKYHTKECINEVSNIELINRLNISEELKREIKDCYPMGLI